MLTDITPLGTRFDENEEEGGSGVCVHGVLHVYLRCVQNCVWRVWRRVSRVAKCIEGSWISREPGWRVCNPCPGEMLV